MKIKKLIRKTYNEKIKLYDITVEKTECFFVGKNNCGILSHNSSITGAINKLAKPFGSGEQLLIGGGFFGTPVKPAAAASRYTSIKINPIISDTINKFMVLNKKNEDDQWEWLKTDIPIGLLTTVVGIAVGYKSTILPRKFEEIQKFLDGKKASLTPYFKSFSGKISSYNGLKKTWLIEGVLEIDETSKSITIVELPPLMKYESFIKKLSKYADSETDFVIQNDSGDNIDITLKYKTGESWEIFKEKISKMIKIIVSENLIFVKDSSVIEFDEIQDYLTEFIVHREYVRIKKSEYDINVYNHELLFLKAKVEYLKFMLAKKRVDSEIDAFLSSFIVSTKTRLERILLKDLSENVLQKTKDLIIEMTETLSKESVNLLSLQTSHNKLKTETKILSKSTKNNRSVDLTIEDSLEVDGIEIFLPDESPEDIDESIEKILEE